MVCIAVNPSPGYNNKERLSVCEQQVRRCGGAGRAVSLACRAVYLCMVCLAEALFTLTSAARGVIRTHACSYARDVFMAVSDKGEHRAPLLL